MLRIVSFLMFACLFVSAAPSAWARDGGCSPHPADDTNEAIDFVEDLLEEGPQADYVIKLPVCMTNLHEDLTEVIIGCTVHGRQEGNFLPLEQIRLQLGTGDAHRSEIDEVFDFPVHLPRGFAGSDVSVFACRVWIETAWSEGYGGSPRHCTLPDDRQRPFCAEPGSELVFEVTHTVPR